jgi:hypothetical protein
VLQEACIKTTEKMWLSKGFPCQNKLFSRFFSCTYGYFCLIVPLPCFPIESPILACPHAILHVLILGCVATALSVKDRQIKLFSVLVQENRCDCGCHTWSGTRVCYWTTKNIDRCHCRLLRAHGAWVGLASPVVRGEERQRTNLRSRGWCDGVKDGDGGWGR